MLDAAHERWLRRELPRLVTAGVLSADAAERIERHYGEGDEQPSAVVPVVFGVLAAALIGGGLILVAAHNWDDLSRPVRTGLAVLPTVVAVALAAWVVATERPVGWREGAAVFWVLSVAGTLGLVSQIYHLPGDWTELLRTWLVLAVPVVYLLGSVGAFLLVGIGLSLLPWDTPQPLLFWVFSAALAPFVHGRLLKRPAAASSLLVAWVAGLTLLAGAPGTVEDLELSNGIPWVVTLMLALWACGEVARPRRWSWVLRLVGGVALVIAAYNLSFRDAWAGYWRRQGGPVDWRLETALEVTVIVLVALTAVGLLTVVWRRGARIEAALWGLALPTVWIAFAVAGDPLEQPGVAAVLVNLYLLILGAGLVLLGLRARALRQSNVGLAILAVLILLRFFDTDWSYLVRGLAFLAIGVSFLVVNRRLLGQRRGAPS